MPKYASVLRYQLIIKKLRSKSANFQEISDYLDRESDAQQIDFRISKRTFERDVQEILVIYKVQIVFDRKQKVYKILEEESTVNERLYEAFDMLHALNITDRLSNSIIFEKRKPLGTDNLYGILHAINNNLQIAFTHNNFFHTKLTTRKVQPYVLKEYKNRWYVLGIDLGDDKLKTFALDRITDLEITSKKFIKNNHFNAEKHFENCFGIIGPQDDQSVQEIKLWVNTHQAKYLKTLPLHHSQEIINNDENGVVFRFKLYITYDFIMEILSLGSNVKVLQPLDLVDIIKNDLEKSLLNYK